VCLIEDAFLGEKNSNEKIYLKKTEMQIKLVYLCQSLRIYSPVFFRNVFVLVEYLAVYSRDIRKRVYRSYVNMSLFFPLKEKF
jgi:hypothetical protein